MILSTHTYSYHSVMAHGVCQLIGILALVALSSSNTALPSCPIFLLLPLVSLHNHSREDLQNTKHHLYYRN